MQQLFPGGVFKPRLVRDEHSIHVPDLVSRIPNLATGPKLLYGKLVRFAGRDGRCFPSQETLATELGRSERQIRRDSAKLKNARLIRTRRRGRYRGGNGLSNEYEFIWHADFDRAVMASRKDIDRTSRSVSRRHPCPPNTLQRILSQENFFGFQPRIGEMLVTEHGRALAGAAKHFDDTLHQFVTRGRASGGGGCSGNLRARRQSTPHPPPGRRRRV
jgi:hypothetical protein